MNKKTIVLAALLIFSLGFLFFSLHPAGKKPISVKNTTEVVNTEDFWKETADLLEKSRLAELPAYYHSIKKDPMQPAFTLAGGANPLAAQPFKLMLKGTPSSLTGIMLGPNKAAAIINEKIYRVGDTVETWKIVSIKKDQVLLKEGAQLQTLKLGKAEFNPL